MKKKFLTAFLMAAVTVSACGAEEKESRGSIEVRDLEIPEQKDPEGTEAKPETVEPAPTQTVEQPVDDGTVHPLHVEIGYEYGQWSNADYTCYATTSAPEITLSEDGYDRLAGALDSYGRSLQSKAEADLNAAIGEMQDPSMLPDFADSISYSSDYVTLPVRSDSVAVSLLTKQYAGSTLSVHPSTVYLSASFDSRTGQELTVYDVLNDVDAFPAVVADALLDKYDAEIFFNAQDLPGTVSDILGMNGDLTYTLGYDGITVYFSPYELAAYVFGPQTVTLRFEDHPDLVREEYARAAEDYIMPLDGSGDNVLPDGRTLSLSIFSFGEEYEEGQSVETVLDGERASFEIYDAFDMKPWLVHVGDRNYLYLTWGTFNDYALLSVCDLNGSRVGDPEEFDRSFHSATDPEDFWLNSRGYLLSTVGLTRSYHVGNDGMPAENMDYDLVTSDLTLTLKQELTCEVRQDFEDPDACTKETLAKGTKLTFHASNEAERWVDFTLPDGRYVRIYVGEKDYDQVVDGIPINDLFDGMLFAG